MYVACQFLKNMNTLKTCPNFSSYKIRWLRIAGMAINIHFLFVIRKIMHNPESHELTINHRPNAQMGFLKT